MTLHCQITDLSISIITAPSDQRIADLIVSISNSGSFRSPIWTYHRPLQ